MRGEKRCPEDLRSQISNFKSEGENVLADTCNPATFHSPYPSRLIWLNLCYSVDQNSSFFPLTIHIRH